MKNSVTDFLTRSTFDNQIKAAIEGWRLILPKPDDITVGRIPKSENITVGYPHNVDKNISKKPDGCEKDVIEAGWVTPKKIWFNTDKSDQYFCTTVEWMDGSKTTVKVKNADENEDTRFSGFTAALAKKIYGTGGAIREMTKAIDRANERSRLRKERAEAMKAERKIFAEEAKKHHEDRIRERVEQLKIEREAQKRLKEGEREHE